MRGALHPSFALCWRGARGHVSGIAVLAHHTMTLLFLLLLLSCSDAGVDPSDRDWPTATPAEVGLDAQMLSSLDDQLESGSYGEIHSLIVVRYGSIVVEEYYRGWTRYSLNDVYSITKSVTSTLLGIAIDEDSSVTLHSNLESYFPEYEDLFEYDTARQDITVENLLTMTSGLSWDESSVSYFDPRNSAMIMSNSGNWIAYVLSRPMRSAPGNEFRYNSGCSVLLGEILRRTVGVPVDEYARDKLFGPMGIYHWEWDHAAGGIINTGWGLSLRTRDLAKIGQLFLRNGHFDGRQVVSTNWTKLATKAHVERPGRLSYGYQWWTMPLDTSVVQEPHLDDIAVAWGWGDQFIFVIPAFDLVVVSTAANQTGPHSAEALQFVPEYIIKAVLSQQ